ncbi:MAG: hypothetical protein QXX79_01705 [Candidatus Bathyarchaeia archaeon]
MLRYKMEEYLEALRPKIDLKDYAKLQAIKIIRVHQFIAKAAELCNPKGIFVSNDSPADIAYIRRMAIETGKEKPMATPWNTVHFDGPYDQGRSRKATKYFVTTGDSLGKALNQIDRKYSKEDYVKQFITRIPKNLTKIEPAERINREKFVGVPEELFIILNQQRERLLKAREKFGTDYVPPECFEEV